MKIIIFGAILVAVLMLSGCTDFLDEGAGETEQFLGTWYGYGEPIEPASTTVDLNAPFPSEIPVSGSEHILTFSNDGELVLEGVAGTWELENSRIHITCSIYDVTCAYAFAKTSSCDVLRLINIENGETQYLFSTQQG